MADCTKTVDFLREWGRMCDMQGDCIGCPMSAKHNRHNEVCSAMVRNYPRDAIAIVQTWSDGHPVMTWEGKLRELLPGAKEEALETIKHSFCQRDIFGFGGDGNCTQAEQCKACCNGEYKEVEK